MKKDDFNGREVAEAYLREPMEQAYHAGAQHTRNMTGTARLFGPYAMIEVLQTFAKVATSEGDPRTARLMTRMVGLLIHGLVQHEDKTDEALETTIKGRDEH